MNNENSNIQDNSNIENEKNQKNNWNIIKGSALFVGGALLGATSTTLIHFNENNEISESVINDGYYLNKSYTFANYPNNIIDLKNYSSTKFGYDSELLVKNFYPYKILNNNNRLYVNDVSDNCILLKKTDSNFNTVYDIKITKDDYSAKSNETIYFIDSFETSSNDLLVFFEIYNNDEDTNSTKMLLNRYDNKGNLIENSHIENGMLTYHNKKSKDYIVSSFKEDASNEFHEYITRYNDKGEKLFSYDINPLDTLINVTYNNENTFLIVNHSSEEGDIVNSELIILDNNGNKIQSGDVNPNNSVMADNVYTTSDGGLLVATTEFLSTENPYDTRSTIMKFDSEGREEWSKEKYSPESSIKYLKEINNEYILVTRDGYTSQEEDGLISYIYNILKIDNSGNVIWEKNLGVLDETNASIFDILSIYDTENEIFIEGTTNNTYKVDIKFSIDFDGNINKLN